MKKNPTRAVKGPDHFADRYEQGPFPSRTVPPWPAGLVALVEMRTGKTFDPEFMAEYERVCSYAGYEGIPLDGPLVASQSLSDPVERGVQEITSEKKRRPIAHTPLPALDETDLGD